MEEKLLSLRCYLHTIVYGQRETPVIKSKANIFMSVSMGDLGVSWWEWDVMAGSRGGGEWQVQTIEGLNIPLHLLHTHQPGDIMTVNLEETIC